MAWYSSGRSNDQLIENMKRFNLIQSPEVEQAMKGVDRAYYCIRPAGKKADNSAYIDSPQPIGYGATISAPHMHAMCLELLKDQLQRPGAHALDVGSGSGYLVSCMAKLIGKDGTVTGIEHIPELVEFSRKNVADDNPGLLESKAVNIIEGDGRLGYLSNAPYDAIHVGAAAAELPQALIDQLKPGGRLIIPLGSEHGDQTLDCIDKAEDGTITRKTITGVRYVPLTSTKHQLQK